MPNKINNLTGKKFGKLLVLEQHGRNRNKSVLWLCRCDCGNETVASNGSLIGGTVQSCGCLKQRQREAVTKHGLHNTKIYKKWQSMKTRCNNPNASNYKDYGGRGITVCDEWLNDFESFYRWAINNGYKEGLTLDRIDVDGDYTPSNCRWATIAEQNNNQRKSRIVTYNGKSQTIGEWAKETGLNYQTIRHRIDVQLWSAEKALTTRTRKQA